MANAPRAAWSELGKPLKWLYDALQLRDQDLPNVLSAAEISSTIDATQNGYAERRHFSLELQGNAAHVSPGVLFGPDAQVNTWAGLQLVTSADLRTDDDAILIHGISLFNGSAGAAGVEFRVSASQVLANDLAAAPGNRGNFTDFGFKRILAGRFGIKPNPGQVGPLMT